MLNLSTQLKLAVTLLGLANAYVDIPVIFNNSVRATDITIGSESSYIPFIFDTTAAGISVNSLSYDSSDSTTYDSSSKSDYFHDPIDKSLSFDVISDATGASLIGLGRGSSILQQLGYSAYSIYTDSQPPRLSVSSPHPITGQVLLGGFDESKITGDVFSRALLEDESGVKFVYADFAVGGDELTFKVTLDITSPYTLIPSSLVSVLSEYFTPKQAYPDETGFIPYNVVALPSVYPFKVLNGPLLNFRIDQFVDTTTKNDTMYLGLGVSDDEYIHLGVNYLTGFYTFVDFANGTFNLWSAAYGAADIKDVGSASISSSASASSSTSAFISSSVSSVFSHSAISSSDAESPSTSTVTEDHVSSTLVTITSCSHDLCSTGVVTTGVTVITTTIDSIVTVYTTYCPLSTTATGISNGTSTTGTATKTPVPTTTSPVHPTTATETTATIETVTSKLSTSTSTSAAVSTFAGAGQQQAQIINGGSLIGFIAGLFMFFLSS
ncbi:hypothetical protein WICPIJ_009439 [Wickerhamomyces pijperi]|uniref:Peptidase A1 domain-containing protein n=1 Tax=Wickerhamomyces pijperi TaxID=599730 RepID=A0A9P8TDM2_WICPI|nr:hypothetical protein WICPIJ_009439 [Wickerhamomyces pijperi]